MPTPVSCTHTVRWLLPGACEAAMVMDPLVVNLMAFPTRLVSTCLSRPASAAAGGRPAGTATASATPGGSST